MEPNRRNRSRSLQVKPENPLLIPITAEEQNLSQLRASILKQQAEEEQDRVERQGAFLTESGGAVQLRDQQPSKLLNIRRNYLEAVQPLCFTSSRALLTSILLDHGKNSLPPIPSPSRSSTPPARDRSTRRERTSTLYRNNPRTPVARFIDVTKMNIDYNQYLTSPVSSGSGSQPRSAPPSPSQGMAHTNGMNGGMGGNGMVGYPTPAGHQSDLNYVMSMVEELSSVLRANQALTESVVEKMGQVRERAQTMNLSNDEMITLVANELNGIIHIFHFQPNPLTLSMRTNVHFRGQQEPGKGEFGTTQGSREVRVPPQGELQACLSRS